MSTIKKTINNPLGADLIQFFIKNNLGLYICTINSLLAYMGPLSLAQIFTVKKVHTNGNLLLDPPIGLVGTGGINGQSYSVTISPGSPDTLVVHNSVSGDFLVNVYNTPLNYALEGTYQTDYNQGLANCTRIPVS